ncbi:curved DNA-binding protein [Nitrosospira sp. Nl5]|uniref:DnaJ C-terminal domain-containing protein n=1 Tax=Nitrosospira sp. Nl5 TaxID=200120 RepID=UPI00087FF59C|nr:DnaJ C-terminal domain-containing protein [Nitrosospira sp. Nl5]SCY28936.1 curved DNA-binding protein [Nitrosospira sp. Nl5]
MEFKDYYKIMGVARNASQDEIKRAYRKLARKYHPDVSKEPNAEIRFKELGEAYEVLKDPEKRAAYDQLGTNWKANQEFRPPPDWNAGFEFSGRGFPGDMGGAGGNGEQYSDFFESLFGHAFRQGYGGGGGKRGGSGGGASFHRAGEDHHAKLLIDLDDSYTGATRSIMLKVPEVDAQGHVSTREHKLNVIIPRGIRARQHIRLAGQGAPGSRQGKPGDLYLEIEFRPHPHYRVDGPDVYLDLPIAPWEAALGATVKTPIPDGMVDLKIPADSGTGRKLRLKGRGIPGKTPGDFFVVLQVVLPPALDDVAKDFYRGMAEQFKSFKPRAGLGV